MSNYVDMQTRIADEIADSTLTSQVRLAIQSAIQFYERKEFYFNTKNGTFNTVANQEYYGSAALSDISNLVTIKTMQYSYQGYKWPVVSMADSDIDFNQTGNLIGPPRGFAYVDEQIRLFWIPDQVYPIYMNYVYRLDTLSADASENAWTNDAEELIRQSAKKRVAGDLLRDVDLYQACVQFEKDALQALMGETAKRRSNRTLRTEIRTRAPYNIYADYGGYS